MCIRDSCVVDGIVAMRYNPSVAVPIPVNWTTSPMFVETPDSPWTFEIDICAAVAELPPINCLSTTRFPVVYADPPSVIVTTPTCPPEITTDALAPCHVDPSELNNLIPWNVPFVRLAPATAIEFLYLTAPYPWGLSNVIVARPTLPLEKKVVTPVTLLP